MAVENFYEHMKPFDDFQDLTNETNFQPVPEDWLIFVADIKGSTKAIEEGRYKDVNMVGASAIACVQNVLPDMDFPFVFGGDGATLLVPPEKAELVKSALAGLRNLSSQQFNLKMRVGCISVSNVLQHGDKVEVAKFALVVGRNVAIFKGGGLSLADSKIKSEPEKYEVLQDQFSTPSLDGLSCRWQPIQNQKGHVLSLLIQARDPKASDTYQNIIKDFKEIFTYGIESANPAASKNIQYKSILQCLKEEARFRSLKGYLKRCLEAVLAVIALKYRVPSPFFNSNAYASSIKNHSDYRKFDDMLRLILDCSTDQKEKIETILEGYFKQGKIFYGIHRSDEALMTCYVQGVSEGEHLHFIDGSQGGYAMAAKQLKTQVSEAALLNAA